ncbi:RNA-binding S4 domain-containing protein [Pseudoroseomonas cervicalis]|uniref:RNA-binding S4 domain-containing protein n=1 Tax=Teichococcus cervicalis TaxID=204525 RepID=UPI002788D087|nr:RNA-binding S4 domain-containing protein [Pseudoroseomonas cervicalis]MDQ1080015.1 ribosome-associated heat shock protein Hsp15 [Pseudoroseomonas cervicalis]
MPETEDRDWQRLDKWLWCARVAKTRGECARLVERGRFRLNRQPVEKPHAKLRPGDVLTLALGSAEHGRIRIWRILALAGRRGPAPEARALYEDLTEGAAPGRPEEMPGAAERDED